jgi:hypothetical protein
MIQGIVEHRIIGILQGLSAMILVGTRTGALKIALYSVN